MANITKAYKIVKQEYSRKDYLWGAIQTTELSKEDTIGHGLRIVCDMPVTEVWINGIEYKPATKPKSEKGTE